MNIPKTERLFYADEQRILKTIQAKKSKELEEQIKYHYFIIFGASGIALTYLATIIKIGFLVFIFGTLAVFAYAFIVFMPYQFYKERKRIKTFLDELNSFINKGTVNTHLIKAKRIALAKEYEDEGDLFIIEYENDKVIYLWDYDYNLKKKFPCLDFEIYEDRFFKLLGRQIYPLSKPIIPVLIDKKAKWNYMCKVGASAHLETENISFDKLIADYNSYI